MTSITSRLAAALLALLACTGSGAVPAAAPGACGSDVRALCQGTEQGSGRVLACLKQHEGQLSELCKAALPALARCAEALASACPDAESAIARRKCAREHSGALGAECRSAATAR